MSFDTLAPHYRWMEHLLAGEKLQSCRTAHLDSIEIPRRALLVGEGNGRFLRAFVERFPKTEITCIDASARMLDVAKAALKSAAHVTYLHSDILEPPLQNNHFDLIVTNFFLDCFPPDQLAPVINKLAAAATPQATWLLADFCEAPGALKKARSKLILSSMYLFFRVATKLPARHLTNPDDLLRQHGFELIDRRRFEWDLLHADLWRRRVRPNLHGELRIDLS
jgi:ubiquinone/menaquinone biosynthesis C-methylase UbiE